MLSRKYISLDLIALSLSLLIVFNYLIMFLFYNEYIGKIIFPSYVILLLFFFIYNPLKFVFFKLSLLLLILISAGSPLTGWDAWAIWSFHAKRIFLDHNFYATLNNYTILHNDYPLMVPSFMVSFAQFLGAWNINFSKLSVFFLYFPIFIYSLKIFDNKFSKIFLIITLIVVNEFLFNVYVDGLVSVYFSFSAILIYEIFVNGKKDYNSIVICFCFLVILSLLKNEGFVLSLIILSFIPINNFFSRKPILVFDKSLIIYLSIVPYVLWKIICIKSGIENDLMNISLQDRFSSIGSILNKSYIISISLFLNYKFIISLTIFLVTFVYFKNKKLFLLTIYFSMAYIMILFFVYLTTPHDLNWHLNTSAKRTMLAIQYFLLLISILNLQIKFKINYKG